MFRPHRAERDRIVMQAAILAQDTLRQIRIELMNNKLLNRRGPSFLLNATDYELPKWLTRMAIAALAACISTATVALTHAAQSGSSNAEQLWYGTIKTKSQWLRTVFHLRFAADGKITGYGVSLDQASAKMQISQAARDKDGNWTMELKTVAATFRGVESKEGDRVTGQFNQKGDIPLELIQIKQLPKMPGDRVLRGELNAIVQKLQMQVRFLNNEKVDGKQLVLVDSLSQKAGSFVGTFEETETERIINVPILSANWKCDKTGNPDGGIWKGTWTQGLAKLPLELKPESEPLDYAAFVKERPQTPKPPFPYETSEVEWTSDVTQKVRLAGTLVVPPPDKLRAGVVLLTGSGPQDRDESIADHKLFWVIADYLARRGIAVLRFDDRGVGKSTGKFATATTEDFVTDATSAWKFLAAQVLLPNEKIGLLGHSEGSSVALEVATKNPNVGFLILMAGAAWDGRRIVVEQAVLMSERAGSPKETVDALRKLLESHCDLVAQNPSADEFKTKTEQLVDEYIKVANIPDDQKEPSRAAMVLRFLQLNGPWYRDFLTRDPARLLPELKQPIFAAWGSLDLQVPAEGNMASMKAGLEKGTPHPKTKLRILSKLNHLMQPCTTGLMDEYEAIETTISPEALEQFSAFIDSVLE